MQLDSKQQQQPRPRQAQAHDVPRSFDFGDRSTFAVEPPSECESLCLSEWCGVIGIWSKVPELGFGPACHYPHLKAVPPPVLHMTDPLSCRHCAVLSRVQAFLPQLAASNAEIARRAKDDPTSVDIETLGGGGPYIQMVRRLVVYPHFSFV